MRITTVDGGVHEIDTKEAHRIASELGVRTMHTEHETPGEYHKRALHNITERAEHYGFRNVRDHEDDIKELMLFAVKEGDADLLGETVEWFISEYEKKVRA